MLLERLFSSFIFLLIPFFKYEILGSLFSKTCGDWHSITRTELQDSALWVVIHTRLGRPIPCAAADLGRPVLIPFADHLDVQNSHSIGPQGFPDLVRSFFKLNGGG